MWKQSKILKNSIYFPLSRWNLSNIFSINIYFALIWFMKTCNYIKKSCLSASAYTEKSNYFAPVKLYRNIDERVFGGVCSGLGLYLGIDKVLIRLIFLLLFVIGFAEDGFFCISMVSYVCLWIAMPAARTVEQKREMKGRPVRLDSYKSKDFDINKEVKEAVESPGGQTIMRVMGVIIGSIFVIIGISGLIGCIIIPSMSTVIGTFVTERIAGGLLAEEALIASKICSSTTFWALVLVMIGIMCVSFIYSGIMMLFNLKSPSWKPELVLFIAWLISICVIAAWTLKTVAEVLPTFLV